MHTPNTFEAFAEIDKSAFSSLQMVSDELNDTIDSISHGIQAKISREYTRIKQEIFEEEDWNFCTFQGKPIKVIDTSNNVYYKPPTNFLRFLNKDIYRNNILKFYPREKAFEMLYGNTFNYIGYIKDNDTNTYKQNGIPQEIKEAIAFKMLFTTFRKTLTSPDDYGHFIKRYSNSLANARIKRL